MVIDIDETQVRMFEQVRLLPPGAGRAGTDRVTQAAGAKGLNGLRQR